MVAARGHQRYNCITGFLGVKNLRLVVESGNKKIGRGVIADPVTSRSKPHLNK